MTTTDGEEKLFCKNVQVLIKGYEQRKATLNINVLMRTSTSPVHRKELYVRLTNCLDLFFLQTLALAEDDFQILKSQQGLLVDFGAFPQKFIDLLELCIEEQEKAVPRFLLHFTTSNSSPGLLEIVETNPFKHLVHLSLKFIHGNDEEIKNYLASRLKLVNDEKENLERQLNGTEKDLSSRLSSTQQLLSERTKQLEDLNLRLKTEIDRTTSKYEDQLQHEKTTKAKLQQSYEERLHTERLSFEERFNKSFRELEHKLKDVQSDNKLLTDHKYKYESLIRELKSRVASLEEERNLASRDVQLLRRQNTNLDSDRHERDKTLNHLRTRVAVLEQEVKDKEQMNCKTNELLDAANEHKGRLDVDLESKSHQVKQLENTIRSVSAEVIKGNEIIQKLQSEIKSLKGRVKMMNIVTTKQEKLIDEKEVVLNQKEAISKEDKDLIKSLQNEIDQLKKNNEDATQKLNDSQETLKNNENVINWLNKQLNEQAMNRLSSTYNTSTSVGSVSNGRIPYTGRPSGNLVNAFSSQQHVPHPRPGSYLPTSYASHSTAAPPPVAQMTHRPILKKPQFQPDGISPIVPQHIRNPLRSKQYSTPVIREENEPVLDPKYLMRKKPETMQVNTAINDENTDPDLVQSDQLSKKTARPYVLSSAYFPQQNN